MTSPDKTKFLQAMADEDKAVSKTFEWVPLSSVPRNKRPLPTRYVLCQKNDGRFKARIVVIGYLEKDNPDLLRLILGGEGDGT